MAHDDSNKDRLDALYAKSQTVSQGMMKASPPDALRGTLEVTELASLLAAGPDNNPDYQINVNTLLNLALIGHMTVANVLGDSTGIKDAADAKRRLADEKRDLPKGDGGLDFL